MKRILLALGLSLMLSSARAGGGDAASVFDHPDFKGRAVPCLTAYLQDRAPGFAGSRVFYVSKVEVFAGGYARALVFDPVINHIVLWEPRVSAECNDLRLSRRYWNLQKDVADDLRGSTSLLWRRDVPGMITRCRSGNRVTITMRAGRFVSSSQR